MASSQASEDEEFNKDYPTGLKLILILTAATFAYFLWFLDLAVISTATPSITDRFDSLVDVGWYGGAYQLGSAAFQPLTGKLYSQFSTKWTFLVFFFIFEVGSALCGAAQSSAMFIVGRTVAGIGAAGIANGTVTIITSVLPTKKQAFYMGINMGIGQLGLATGPIIGGAFTTKVSWRWCFYVNLPCGALIAAFLLFINIPEQTAKGPPLKILGSAIKSLDLPGFILICPAVTMFLLGLQFGGNEYAWDSSVVIGLLVGSAVTFAVFLVLEHYQGDIAMVPIPMLRHRVIWSTAMTMFWSLSSVLVADFYIAIYFQAIRNDSPLLSGVHMLPITLGIVILTVISGVGISVLGYYLPFLLFGGAILAVAYGLLSTLSSTTSVGRWIGYEILYGVAAGCTTAAPYIAIQNLVSPEQISLAMSIVIFWQNIGASTSLIAANAIFSNSLRKELRKRASQLGGVSPDAIVAGGVTAIRQLVSGSALTATLQAYAKSVDNVMYLGIACSICIMIFSPGLGWKDIRKTKDLHKFSVDSPGSTEKDSAKMEAEEDQSNN